MGPKKQGPPSVESVKQVKPSLEGDYKWEELIQKFLVEIPEHEKWDKPFW